MPSTRVVVFSDNLSNLSIPATDHLQLDGPYDVSEGLRMCTDRDVAAAVIDVALRTLRPSELSVVLRGRFSQPLPILVFGPRNAVRRAIREGWADASVELSDTDAGRLSLEASVRRVIVSHAPSSSYVGRRLRVRFDRAEVHVDDYLVHLSALELRVLRHLLRNVNAVVRREEFMSEVWQRNPETPSRSLDVHILRLRRKLGSAGTQIQTVQGGYRFYEPESAPVADGENG